MIYDSWSEEDTYRLAEELGEKAMPGEIYTLSGDLGVGKTVFSKGFAKGLGVGGHVSSPTFTIVQVYEDGRMPLYHFDVYRIGDCDEMDEIGYEDYFYGDGVCLVEWAECIEQLLPQEVCRINIQKDLQKGLAYRRIEIKR